MFFFSGASEEVHYVWHRVARGFIRSMPEMVNMMTVPLNDDQQFELGLISVSYLLFPLSILDKTP